MGDNQNQNIHQCFPCYVSSHPGNTMQHSDYYHSTTLSADQQYWWHMTQHCVLITRWWCRNILGCLSSSSHSHKSHHRRASEPHLRILPAGSQEIRAGKNLVLTCRAQVPNIPLIKHLRWINPRGQEIPQDDRSVMRDEVLMEIQSFKHLFFLQISAPNYWGYPKKPGEIR